MDADEKPKGEPVIWRRRSTDLQAAPDLPQAEREEGFIRPVRRTYRHVVCDKVTSIGQGVAEMYARDPKCFGNTYCHHCQADFPVGEFAWEGTDELVGS